MKLQDINHAREIIYRRSSARELNEMLQSGRLTKTFFERKMATEMIAHKYERAEHLSRVTGISELGVATALGEKLLVLLEKNIKMQNAENSLVLARQLENLVWVYRLDDIFDKMRDMKAKTRDLQGKSLQNSQA